MKYLITIFAFYTTGVFAQVPEPTIVSFKNIGGNNISTLQSPVTKTPDGGFIINIQSNATHGSGNIDSFCIGSDNRYMYLKYNADASVLEWSKCFTHGPYIFPQPDGSFVFGEQASAVSWAYQVTKTDASGSVLWSKNYGGQAASAILKCMTATSDGGYIMAGGTNYTDTDFTIHYGSWMDEDIAIVKVDSAGNKIWSKVIGGTGNDIASSLLATPDGGCYLTGSTTSDDHDCTGNHGGKDVYLVKIDGNGNIIWHEDLGGRSTDGAAAIISNGKGGIIIAAAARSNDGDVSHFIPSPGGGELWTLECDGRGHILWDNCYGGGDCEPVSICKSIDGSIWIGCYTSLKFGQIDTAYGYNDAWFVHTDSAGNFLNAKVMGSNDNDAGVIVYPLSNNNVLGGGYFSSFDGSFASLIPNTGINTFLTIFDPATNRLSVQNNSSLSGKEVKIYPNPAHDRVTVEGRARHNYKIVINNMGGTAVYSDSFEGKIKIRTGDWPKGTYIVIVTDENAEKTIEHITIQ